jgi:hypothetical protein|tara:strand:- start:3516 stop:4700 length:1185 start_codon:yes stop_codon:yes gene_type:complete
MPRISLWKDGTHTNDFKFFDRNISEMFTVGGTGINVHKYIGILDQGKSDDASQPQATPDDPLAIQDFLFLENRDRKYDTDVYNMRGIYNVADTDFDLSQFGLFLQNDTLFITFHMTDMDRILGRRLMSGDVLELPHLKDYNSLDTSLEVALKRYYVIQEGTRPTEGYSPTWWPHLWRVKATPLVDSQEYNDILNKIELDADGESTGSTLRDLLSTYQKELEVTNKVVEQAEAEVPESGYDTSKYYVVPTDSTGKPLEPKGHNADSTLVTADSDVQDASSTRISPDNTRAYSGYLVGDGLAPNGYPIEMGTAFPGSANEGDYILRLDFLPNRLFRYSGTRWVKVEDDVRSKLTPGTGNTLRDGFINNSATTSRDDNTIMSQRQALSSVLEAKEDS